jgi:predicted phosphoribosyltransferase
VRSFSQFSEPHGPYRDRRHAGAELSERLRHLKGRKDVVVVALPRGGVPVAHEVARAINAPLDVFLVRKLGLPSHPELAMGAIASGGVRVLNDDVIDWFGVPRGAIDAVARAEQQELERREDVYRNGRPAFDLRGRTVILVDDGLATGSSMKAAVQAVRLREPAQIIVAVPVGSARTCEEFADIADEIVCGRSPQDFAAVGQWYRDFSQTTDQEVSDLLSSGQEPVVKTP